ncbi:MAG: O-antigen ligase family protein [Candidatus Roizmanbacteria bacterium]|nr:O-antigen ligase family protein [Candidatus Roizmanbacteria bacterium]
MNVYKDLVLSLLLFFTILNVQKDDFHILIGVFLISSVGGLFYQYIYIFAQHIIDIFRPFLNITAMQFVEYQSSRRRYFGDTMDEALIPMLLNAAMTTKNIFLKFTYALMLIAILFLVILSSWRTKFIICLYSILMSFFIFKTLRKYTLALGALLILIFTISSAITLVIVGQNVYDRFLVEDKPNEVIIQNSRISYLMSAFQMGKEHIVSGVGLGNYYDNLSNAEKIANQYSPAGGGMNKKFIVIDDPHNIFFGLFATTGIIGLLSFVGLLSYFIFTDIPFILKKGFMDIKIYISIFWGYFIFAFFNPWMYFSFFIPFWFFRGIIENIKLNND